MSGQENYIQNVKVMIVDDHDPIRKAMKRILTKMGARAIVECFDGEDAIKELQQNLDIELVLCDLYMRRVDGFQVLAHIRNRSIGADIPIIIVTGEASKEDIVKASALGADDYVIKPFQAESMISKIQQLLTAFFNPPPLTKALRAGDKLIVHQRYAEALAVYQKALTLDARSVRTKHAIAVALDLCGKSQEAIKQLQENIDLAPSYYKNYASLANIYLRSRQNDKAIAVLLKELEYNPKQPHRQVLIAKLLSKKGDFAGSIAHFREALKENSHDHSALMGSGQAYALTQDLEKAIYYFKRARRHGPNDSKSLQAIIKFAMQAGEPKKAELALKDEKTMHPERHDTYVLLAKFLIAGERYEEAAKILNELFQLDQENIEGLKVRGILEMKTQKYEEAIKTLQDVCKKAPDAETYLSLAECLQAAKKFPESFDILHQVLLLSPQNPTALYLLGSGYKKTKQFAKAVHLFIAAKNAGVHAPTCAKNIQLCWEQIKTRRSSALKMSA